MTYDPTATYSLYIESGFFTDSEGNCMLGGDYYYPPLPSQPTPTDAPDYGSAEYWQRHYDYWLPIHAQLMASSNNGTVTVDTAGQDLDHIQHFVFDALNNTSRTLIVKHQGQTYTIRGRAESADHLRMGSIMLGHNHSFKLLHDLGYSK